MITKNYIILILMLISLNILAQKQENYVNNFKAKIHIFYDILYEKTNVEFREIGIDKLDNRQLRSYFSELTFNVSYDSINKVIIKLELHNEGYTFSEFAILKFGNNKEIFFLISMDSFIGDIYLSGGENLENKMGYDNR